MIQKYVFSPAKSTSVQLFRYLFAGGTAAVVDFALLFILTEFFLFHYLLSAVIAFILALITNYVISIAWVFHTRKISNKYMEGTLFILTALIGLGLNTLILWFLTEKMLVYYMMSKIVATGTVFFWNFFSKKYILF
ncbi:MAG: GtrA family protein [Candidatus Cyclobacteriaceae bacterium M3_2C_046]